MKKSRIIWPAFKTIALAFLASLFTLQQPLFASDHAAPKEDTTMGHGSAEDVVVATVNGQVINMAQLMRTMTEISRTKHGSQEISPLLAQKIKQEATEELIIEELAYQKASAVIKTVPAELLEEKIAAVRKKYKDEETFQAYIADNFGGMEGFKQQLNRFLALDLFINQQFDSKIEVSDQEVQKAYDETKSQSFVTDEFVQVNDIIFFLDPDAPDAKDKANKVIQTISAQFDNDPTRMPTDGSFSVEKNVPLDKAKNPQLYEAARVLKEYGWSAPINVDGNLHVVQLIGYKPAVNKSLAEVTPFLKAEIKKQKRQEALNRWMAGLKEGADIKISDLTR